MKNLLVRAATAADGPLLGEWVQSTKHNRFDPMIATYPNLIGLVVEQGGRPLMFLPAHPVLCIESAACKPGITGREYIEALLRTKAATEDIARQYGMREIYTSSVYEPMAKTLRRHGYEDVPGALRKRIK